MKKLLLALSLVILTAENAPAQIYPVHHWELGIEAYHFTYKEPDVMKDSGPMVGLAGSYEYHRKLMLKLEGRASWGQVNYSSETSGSTDNISDWTLEFRALAGYDVSLSPSLIVTPYLGIGYRYLYDDFGGHTTTTNAAGYDRESNYYYSPVGAVLLADLGNGWAGGITGEYDIFWWGRQKSHLSDVPGYYDIVNQQNRGYGARGSLLLRKKADGYSVTFEPFIRYWSIEDSETTTDPSRTTWVEPKNNTTEIGARLGVRF